RSACLLDLLDRRLGSAGDVERKLRLDVAIAQHAHAVTDATDDAGLHQRRGVHGFLGVELLGIDRSLEPRYGDRHVVLGGHVAEAALRQAAVERHLAALEAVDGDARARALALHAAAGGLAGAGADAAPYALARL